MAKRLIDADRTCFELERFYNGYTGELRRVASEALDLVGMIPEVDAVEVVHGKWIWDELNECWVCSNCEDSALNNYRWQSVDSNYCPNCGAKMDGGKEK